VTKEVDVNLITQAFSQTYVGGLNCLEILDSENQEKLTNYVNNSANGKLLLQLLSVKLKGRCNSFCLDSTLSKGFVLIDYDNLLNLTLDELRQEAKRLNINVKGLGRSKKRIIQKIENHSKADI